MTTAVNWALCIKYQAICGQGRFESVQFKMVFITSEKPVCPPLRLSDVSPKLPFKRFQCSPDWQRPSLVLSRKVVEHFLSLRLSPPGDSSCDVPGFGMCGLTVTSWCNPAESMCDCFHFLCQAGGWVLALPSQHTGGSPSTCVCVCSHGHFFFFKLMLYNCTHCDDLF